MTANDKLINKAVTGVSQQHQSPPNLSKMPELSSMGDLVFTFFILPDGTFCQFSSSASKVLGYPAQQCEELFLASLSDNDINHQAKRRIDLALQDERQAPFELEVKAQSGHLVRIMSALVPHYNDVGALQKIEVVAYDISAVQHKLFGYKRKSILLDEAEKITCTGTWDWDLSTGKVRWSKEFYNIVQLPIEQTQPGMKSYIELLMPEDAKTLTELVVKSIKTQQVFEHFHRLFLKDGRVKYIESRSNTLVDEQGEPVRMIGTIHDVTNQVEAQSQLEKAYRMINSSINEIYIIDRDTYRFSFASEGACRNLGYTQKEMARLTPFDLCPVIPKLQVMEMMAPVMDHKEDQVVFEVSHLRKDGSTYPVELRLQLMEKDGPPMFVAVGINITERKAALQKVREKAVLLRSVIDATKDLIFFKDKNSRYAGCNKAFEKLAGLSEREIVSKKDNSFFSNALAEQFERADKEVFDTGNAVHFKDWTRYADGKRVLLETTKTPYYDEEGRIQGVVGVCSDATEHWQYENKLEVQARFLQSIIDNINESVLVVGLDGEIRLQNKTAKHFIEQGVLLEPNNRGELTDKDGNEQPCPLAEVFKRKIHKTVVHNHTQADGTQLHIEIMVSPLLDESENVTAAIEIGRDITSHLQLQRQLERQKSEFEYSAHYDSLTQLPNRILFHDRLTQSIAKARRHKETVAVLFLDLDRFKQINDTYGHGVGDKVLQAAAKRIKSCVREMDSVARLGGDEFTVILESLKQPQGAAMIAHKINQAMRPAIVSDGKELFISTSIGIALYPDNGDSIEQLLQCADEAMYRVKQQSRDSFQFYNESLTGSTFERALMESQLRTALVNHELEVFYQSQWDLRSGEMVGIEALVRWNNQQLGSILPTKFIPLAEDVGLIQEIDEWVLETASKQMVQWKHQGLGNIRLAVNLSSNEFARKNLVDVVSHILEKTQCRADWLEIEVAEGSFTGSFDSIKTVLSELKTLGFGLAIDDFGTGYSSLAKLRYLPINKLKIDHSFINNVPDSADDTAIATAVIGLAKSLGMKVIAEGVETEQQRNFLVAQQCDEAQGYLFSRPVNAETFIKQLNLTS